MSAITDRQKAAEYNRRWRAKHHARLLIKEQAWRDQRKEELRLKSKQWREANLEKSLENSRKNYHAKRDENVAKKRAYNAARREEINAKSRAYRVANLEKARKRGEDYRARNREILRAKDRAYARANPSIICASAMRRHARRRMAMPPWADTDAIRAFYEEAARLTRETGVKHHVDHIVPLSGRGLVCGLHVAHNLQVLTESENCRKSNKVEGRIAA